MHQLRKEMLESRVHPIGAYQDISLVQKKDGETLYVYWTAVESRAGRRVYLNRQGHVMCIVYANTPEEKHLESTILIPRTGATQVRGKARKAETPIMAEWVRRCKFMFDATQFGGPYQDDDDSLPDENKKCVVCVSAGSVAPEHSHTVVARELFVCRCCFTSWHSRCAEIEFIRRHAEIHEQTYHLDGTFQANGLASPKSFICPFCTKGLS